MKPYEVALFKQFLDVKGMVTPFINLFKKFRIKTNPTLIEDYLLQVDPKEVCMKAFYWVVNLRWGYDYWSKVQKEFDSYLEKNKYDETQEAEPWWYLHGKFKILRTNWDAEKHWKYETRSATAKRFGITLPERLEEKRFFEELALMEIQSENLVQKKNEAETPNAFNDFSFVDLPPIYAKLKSNEISINRRNKKHSITVNQNTSKEILQQGVYKYAGLMTNKTGDIALVFNNVNGVPIITDARVKKSGYGNVIINSKKLVERLVDLLGVKENYVVATIKEISKTSEHMAFQVSMK